MRKVLAAAVLAATVSACGETGTPTVGASELALVSQSIDAELNAPLKAAQQNLVRANADKAVYPQELVITGPGDATPTDWWLYKLGYLKLAGAAGYQAYFGLTPTGEAFAGGGAPHWLASALQGEPQSECSGSHSTGVCKVSGTVTVAPTAAGAGPLTGVAIATQPFTAELEYTPAGWRVTSLTDFRTKAHLAIFGDAATIAAARSKWAGEVNRQVR
jgi:hypothetical protein